ncbi:PilW family protein [Agaribacter flavus]|uniref:PilW family protein n=1 Tax=Agaribacter flavus TaxID=1902781 RepID=A0ABV7FSJ2_9ALTE
MKYKKHNTELGVTLVELMISLALGLVISGAVVQILVSNSVTDKFNKAVASAQENGRYIMSRFRDDLLMTGLYDPLSPNLSRLVDIVEEGAFVRNHPVPLPGDFVSRPALGALQGANGDNDTLVVSLQSDRDCRAYDLGYGRAAPLADEEFYVVNEYFVDGGKLKCRGFDGRYLRGQKPAVGHNSHSAVTLLDDVLSFQVVYGITQVASTNGITRPIRYVSANELPNLFANNAHVVAVRIALVVKGEGEGFVTQPSTFKLLNENSITAPDNGLYKAFETTITLRNTKNFARGQA